MQDLVRVNHVMCAHITVTHATDSGNMYVNNVTNLAVACA